MRLLAISVFALALSILGGSAVIAAALDDERPPSEIQEIRDACDALHDGEQPIAGCILDIVDRS